MRFTTDALVIRETNTGEQDRMVTLLTRDKGQLHAYAPGAKSIKSKKGAATGLLAYSSMTVAEKNGIYRIYEATPIRIFFGAGSDIIRLSLSQYFCELCAVFVPQGTEATDFLRLVLNSLHFLTVEKREPALIKAITELRIATISGYCPNLVACEGCGKYEDDLMFFSSENGMLFCDECKQDRGLLPVNRTVLSAMRHIVYSELTRLYAFDIPKEDAQKLSEITENYIMTQTDHRFSTLDFYNQMKK